MNEMERTTPLRVEITPARKALVNNALCFFKIYEKEIPYWPNWRVMAHTHPDDRPHLQNMLLYEEEERVRQERAEKLGLPYEPKPYNPNKKNRNV